MQWINNSIYNFATACSLLNSGFLFCLWKRNGWLQFQSEFNLSPYRKGPSPSLQGCLLILSHISWRTCSFALSELDFSCHFFCFRANIKKNSVVLRDSAHCLQTASMSSFCIVCSQTWLYLRINYRVLKIEVHWPQPWRVGTSRVGWGETQKSVLLLSAEDCMCG